MNIFDEGKKLVQSEVIESEIIEDSDELKHKKLEKLSEIHVSGNIAEKIVLIQKVNNLNFDSGGMMITDG